MIKQIVIMNTMNFVVVFHFILYCLYLEPKLCVNCKFFKKELFQDDKFGKCSLFPKVNEVDYFLVNGVKQLKKIDYQYCSVIRSYDPTCGKEGKLFERKKKWFE
jgi:hypothetical protein